MLPLARISCFILLIARDCFSQSVFRDELFPEQLMQQQLQFKQNDIQNQLQVIQNQLPQARNEAEIQTLQSTHAQLMIELQEINRQMLQLQQLIQDRLGGGHRFNIPDLSAPNVIHQPARGEVSENKQDQNIVIINNVVDMRCVTTSNQPGVCSPLIQCLSFYTEHEEVKSNQCFLREGEVGVCCPIHDKPQGHNRPTRTGILEPPPPPDVVTPNITPEQIDNSVNAALQRINDRVALVSDLIVKNIHIETGSAAAWHQELFPTTNETLQIGEGAQKGVEASVGLVKDFNLTPKQGTFALPRFSILNTILADTCPRPSKCHAHKYRSTDGSCNNLQHQHWGTPGTALQRILPPKYGDGVNLPRTHSDRGNLLPSARLVSVIFAQEKDVPSQNYTLMLMQWGQFVDHDLTHTPISRGQSGFGISCCRNGRLIDSSLRHPDCFAIELPPNDHMFSRFGERCMEFVRSLPAPRPGCNFGPREQMNQITGYLDGSGVYGSSLDSQRNLRQFSGGKLRSQDIRGRQLLPANPSECADQGQNLACFSAGDGRVNEQVELALMHTIWLREHNRLADILASMHPDWSDEAVFQEARRIVVAEIQHITFNEFLPIVLGQHYMNNFQLAPRESGWTQLYDPELNPGITNVFATAAYRFGHTLIQNELHGYGKFGNIREHLKLSKQHFAPFDLYREGAIDDFVRGLSFQSAQSVDRFFSKEVTDHLFQGNLNFGLDLIALNIQRGRDHGLPPYNEWRDVCGLKRARSWNDLEDVMDTESIERLSKIYDGVDEVDLFVAGVAEQPLPGALLGPTFVCIIGDQFARLRRGDRFFYEEAGPPSTFSEVQLNEIRKVSLSRILCDNSDDVVVMQPLAFMKPSFLNQRVSCDSPAIPRMSLEPWLNERPAVP